MAALVDFGLRIAGNSSTLPNAEFAVPVRPPSTSPVSSSWTSAAFATASMSSNPVYLKVSTSSSGSKDDAPPQLAPMQMACQTV